MKEVKYPSLVAEIARHGEYQKTLAKLLGTTNASLSRKLSGITQWKKEDIDKICEHYNKSYEELFK